jgi:hypothetical protein
LLASLTTTLSVLSCRGWASIHDPSKYTRTCHTLHDRWSLGRFMGHTAS